MQFGSVEIPEALLEALQNNKLVVFAGAGVSMGEPANYPDFGKLAEKINEDNGNRLELPIKKKFVLRIFRAGSTTKNRALLHKGFRKPKSGARINKDTNEKKGGREEKVWIEPIDRFLGRLEEKGVNVKKSACQLLNLQKSQPTILHQSLVKLFKTPDKLRLVTTNFDPLFNNYAKELWGQNDLDYLDYLDYYYAPALPLGNDFTGIVYLHGSVLKDEKRIVITDKDFGRAYLTEGWARDFLQAMFSEYTVLFIGYSYTDPVIPYLTRGLPPSSNNSRFAFISDNDDPTRWKHLGIEPVIYSNKNRHEALGICLQSWVEHIEMGALKHEHRIKEIVSLPSPPLEPKDLSYIKNALKDITKVGHFTKHCNKTLDWLSWVDKQGVFNELFQLNSPVSEISHQVSWWLAEYVIIFPEETLRFVQGKGNLINFNLWSSILREIWSNDNIRLESNIFLRWIIFLLQDCQVQYKSDFNDIDYLLRKCKYPDDRLAALLLFEYLTKPQWANSQTISLVGDPYWLKEAWQDFFKPNLSGFAINLEPIVTSHLQKASWMKNAIYRDNENFCFSGFRFTIEPYQDASNYRIRDIDILIDAARDILENLLIETPDYAHGVIEGWNISGIRILRRLAIHGIIKSTQLSSDEKIQWLIKNDLIINYSSFQDEISRLLKNAYLLASNTTHQSLLQQIEGLHDPVNNQDKNYSIYSENYDYFLILKQLYELSPECDFVTQKFEKIKQAFADVEPEGHPNIAYTPITAEGLLQKNLADTDTIDWLLTYDEQVNWSSKRGYFLEEIQKAVIQNFEWSYQLAKAIQERQDWSSDIWLVILLGWQKSKFTEEQWEQTLSFFVDHPQLYIFRDRIIDLLNIRQEQSEIHLSCFSLAKELTKSLWEIGKNNPQRVREDFDWLSQAINNDSGKITLLWLRMLSKEQQNLEKINQKIPDYYRVNFNKILEGEDYQAELGRVILCSQLNFLFSLDPNWTRENIIPLFGWKTEKKQAQQAWCGFLMWGKCNGQILSDLMPLYKQTFSHLVVDLNYRENARLFCDQIVDILIYASSSSFDEGNQGKLTFISDFIKQVDSTIKEQFSRTIYSFIGDMQEDSIKILWDEWLKTYWQERNIGRPVSLEFDELKKMVNWLIYLKPVFNEAVDLLCESLISADNGLINSFGIHQLSEDRYYATLYPEALTKLLLHLLKNTSPNQILHFNYIEKIFRQLVETEVPRGELCKICDELSRLICPNALELSQLLNNEE